LGRDPAMRWIVGGRAAAKQPAFTSQLGRSETELPATGENHAALNIAKSSPDGYCFTRN